MIYLNINMLRSTQLNKLLNFQTIISIHSHSIKQADLYILQNSSQQNINNQ